MSSIFMQTRLGFAVTHIYRRNYVDLRSAVFTFLCVSTNIRTHTEKTKSNIFIRKKNSADIH